MFVGMSAMTILEWLELLAFSIVAMPFLVFRQRGLSCVRQEDDDDGDDATASHGDGQSASDTQILEKIVAIARRRRAAKVLYSHCSQTWVR